MNIGKALWMIRNNELNILQIEAAKKIGITQSYLSQIEDGFKNPSQKVLEKICYAYGIPMAIVIWMATYPEDVQKEKRQEFNLIREAVDDLINDFLSATIRK